jgi:hypothetical protein
MAELKYLITVDSETGVPTKLEKVGESGELTPIDLRKVSFDLTNVGGTSIIVNIYGSAATVAPQKDVVKLTDGGDFCICFPGRPPGGRAR